MRDALRMALGTLTALPVPAPGTIDRRVAGAAMLLAPVAAVVPAVLAGTVVWLGALTGLPSLVTATLAVGAVALATRGLHLDGLSDTADGLGASYDRERALEVMRRGDAGPTGVAALLFVVLVQTAALAGAVSRGDGVVAVVLGVVAGRAVLPLCCVRGVPPARPEGLGAAVAGAVPVPVAVLAGGTVAGLAVLAPGLPWWQGPVAVLAGYAVAGLLLARCVRRLGGSTGDVLGACVEVATATTLLVVSA